MNWRKIAKRVLLAVLLLVVAVGILIHTPPFQQFLLRQAEEVAERAGVPFTADRLRLRPFDLELSLDNLSYNRDGVDVRVTSLTVDLPWNILSADGIVINSLDAEGVRVAVTSPEPVIPEPSGEPTSLPSIRIDRLSIQDGSFSYENQSTRVEVPEFSLVADEGRGTLRLGAPVTMTPDMTVRIPEIPVRMAGTNLQFGPADWAVQYGERSGGGSTTGSFQWTPSITVSVGFETNPLTVEQWDGIVASGRVLYADGTLNVTEFRATRGEGQVTGAAEISDEGKSATVIWTDVRIDPSGVRGVTGGAMDLQWQESDFSDVSGNGRVTVRTRQYGNAQSDVRIEDGRARLNIQAASMGADIRANIVAGLDRTLSGTFRATHKQYGAVTAQGNVSGTLDTPTVTAQVTANDVTYRDVGPVDGAARVAYRGNVLNVTDISARMQNSVIPEGSLRINLNNRAIEGAIPTIDTQLQDFIPDGSGQIQASAQLTGTLDRPVAELTASSSGLDIGGTHIDSVQAEAHLEDEILEVTQLVARQSDGILEASGVVNLETQEVQAQANVSNLQITQVRGLSSTVNLDADVSGTYRMPEAMFNGELLNVVYQGQEHGNLTFSGVTDRQTLDVQLQSPKYSADVDAAVRLQAPYAYTATVVANQSDVQYRQYNFMADGQVQAAGNLQPFVLERLQLEGLTVNGEGVNLTAAGSLDTGVKVDLTAQLAELPVDGVQLGGQAQIDAVVRGSIDNPQVEGTLRTANATVRTDDMPEAATVEAAVDFTRDQFTIREMSAELADARAVIDGSGTLRGTGEFTFDAENIRPERFLPERPLAGVVGLEGRVTVNAPRLDAIEGEATVTQLDLSAQGVEIEQTQQGRITFANRTLTIQDFTLQGPETQASVEGTANLNTGALNFDVAANTDLRIIEGFVPRSNALGRIESEIAIRGTTKQPDMTGFVNLDDAQIQLAQPPLVFSEVDARVRLNGSRLQIEQASGDLNGGAFTVAGATGISSSGFQNAALQITLMGTQLEYPEGLQSEISAKLALNGTPPGLTLTGNVNVLDALYRREIDLREEVFQRLTPQEEAGLAAPEEPGLADRINLDIAVATTGPVAIANNVANMNLIGDFRVRGTAGEPVVLGRAEALEGGEVYFGPVEGSESAALGERRDRYIIERGIVDFNNPLQTEPRFDFEATHELQARDERYLIRLRAFGTPTDFRTELTADPYLSEPDIVAMLLTGRSFTDLQGAHLAVAREQVFNYLSGQLTSRFFEGAGTALGLDTVTIEPVTIASEEDISARLTVGKDLTRDLSLVYSQNLSGPRNQAWILDYSTIRDFVLRGINRPDQNEIRFELRHGLEFGGGPPLPRRIAPRDEATLAGVTFTGSTFSPEMLMEYVTEPGEPYNIYRMNDDVRALRQFFATGGFLNARVRGRRSVAAGRAEAAFTIDQGPHIAFEYRGADIPRDVREQIVQIWVAGFASASSLQESIDFLLRYFRDEGYLEANVSARNESQDAERHLYVYEIAPGMRFRKPQWVFQGVDPVEITESAGLVMEDPEAIRERIEFQFRSVGFLDVESTTPELVMDNGEPRFEVTVNRGLQYMVTAIHHEGNSFFTDDRLTRVVILGPTPVLPPGEPGATRPPEAVEPLEPFPYTSDWVGIGRRRVMTEYWQEGFNEVQIGSSTDYVPGSGRIEVSFNFNEGPRQMISDVQIRGDNKTALSHVRRYFEFMQGDPVDYTRINLTRKQLYDTGLFKRVDIEVSSQGQGYLAQVNLNERAPWELRYGVTVTDHEQQGQARRDLGFSAEATQRNIFGKGILAGASLRLDPRLREARFFNSFPVFLDRDVTSTGNLFRSRETLPDVVSNMWGFTLQQQWRLRDFYLLSYDYGYRRVSTFERDLAEDDPDIANNEIIPVARFNATLSRDTRDDILNATRGTFFSNSLDLAPPGVGSSIRYVRNYTQYLRFREVWRPNLIWASAYRLGLARVFADGQLVETDRFTAGGTSLRAFSEDSAVLKPGNALFVTNQELRYPLFWRFGVVGFFDIGNVYERVGVARVWQPRYSPGLGLRLNTPFVLLRVDFGFNLWPRTGEDKQTISWGIGQAF